MKYVPLLLIFFIATAGTCNRPTSKNSGTPKAAGACYKARLEIKGICMNYVIKVLEGDTAALKLEQRWTDETDNKTYTNVFALGSPCTFPDMKEGDEFYFTLAPQTDGGCNVCMAYRPVPGAKNSIAVSQTPCR